MASADLPGLGHSAVTSAGYCAGQSNCDGGIFLQISLRNAGRVLSTLLLAVQLGACSLRSVIVDDLADVLATQGQGEETDLELLRDAAPFHLKLSESVLSHSPGHVLLAESVAAGFTQYAYAFVAFDAEQIEAQDAKSAERLRQRAAKLYARAHRHAMAALELASPGFAIALASPQEANWPSLKPEQVGLAYWAAAAWGGWISLVKDDPELIADLPLAARLARRAWTVDPGWGQGALTGLLGSFEAARPGGNATQALAYFDQAIAQGGDRNLGPLLGKAEGYALPAGQRTTFETLLKQALAIPDAPGSPLSAQNEVMRRRARWLLEKADDLF